MLHNKCGHARKNMKKEKIAIIGIGCIFPDAPDFTEYWRNIIETKDSVRDISGLFWDKADYYDENPKARDMHYCTMGATVDPIEFDSMEFGISPKVMESTSVEQLFALIAARQALIDAGMYGENAKEFNRKKTGVILSAPIGKNAFYLCNRTVAPKLRKILRNNGVPEEVIERVVERYLDSFCEWSEDSNPGYIANVVAGRIANRFDLGGTSCCVDAACGSSLASLKFAVDELQNGNCDVMLTGGANLDSSEFSYISFCKTPAISKTHQIKPFDEKADGMILGDGVGIIVLKRLSDAQRDHDSIYAVIQSVGSSSDGKAKSIYAPSKDGQTRALRDAYEKADVSPDTVGLIEAHGTGTAAGDACEVSAISEVFQRDTQKRDLVIGSVKSQIGHLRMSAGIAGVIKTALALHEKILPASIHVQKINPVILHSNLCVLAKPKAWLVNARQPVRRAGVSAFGFGGTNYHAVLEEYDTDYAQPYRVTFADMGVMLCAPTKAALDAKLQALTETLREDPRAWYHPDYRYHPVSDGQRFRLAFAAKSAEEVGKKCEAARKLLASEAGSAWVKQEIAYSEKPVDAAQKITVLFSGQGTQRVNMLSSLTMTYPELRRAFTTADNVMLRNGKTPVSELIYPNCQTGEELERAEAMLRQTEYAQPALAVLHAGLYTVLQKRGLCADFRIGHSFGELAALWADGAMDTETLITTAQARGSFMAKGTAQTAMLAVMSERAVIEPICKAFDKVYLANENSPKQMVLSGDAGQLKEIETLLTQQNIRAVPLQVSAAFHSPYMQDAAKEFRAFLDTQKIEQTGGTVIANVNGQFYSTTGQAEICDLLEQQLVQPVRFQTSVEKAYQDGSRVFVEIGNGRVLSNLTADILADADCTIIPVCPDKNKDSLSQFEFAMARLAVLGVEMQDDPYRVLPDEALVPKKTKTSYTVNADIFYLPAMEKRIREAVEAVAPAPAVPQTVPPVVETKSVVVMPHVEPRQTEMQEDVIEMACEQSQSLQALNADVFSRFMETQNEQIHAIAQLFEKSGANSEQEKKQILDCVQVFQNNSMQAFETYFSSQTGTVGTPHAVMSAAPVSVQAPAAVRTEAPAPVQPQIPAEKTVADSGNTPAPTAQIQQTIVEIISNTTGYPTDMIEPDMELEADLGIDSIKRVEILSDINTALGEIFTQEDVESLAGISRIQDIVDYVRGLSASAAPTVASASAAVASERPAKAVSANVKDAILDIISNTTGYPTDMIEPDMELEADLGIDSIKRVEIFADINETLACNLTTEDTECLAELMNIQDIIAYISEKV